MTQLGNNSAAPDGPQPLLRISGLEKRFGSTVALDRADLDVREGSIHGVIGENGAGKSTLVKILAGLVEPDSGTLLFGGDPLELDNTAQSLDANIATAFQELSLVPDLSVAQNLALPRAPRSPLGTVSSRATRAEAKRKLSDWEIDHIDPRTPARSLSLAARQQVEIVGALSKAPRLLILDEPTSALGRSEVEWLFRQVHRVRRGGATVIFVSHRLIEVRLLCDAVTVLRNGKRAGSVDDLSSVSDDQIIRMMIGESLAEIFPAKDAQQPRGQVALEARGIRSENLLSADLALHHGEVLGVAGLQDHGQRDLFRALFGAQPLQDGKLTLDGRPIRLRSPRDAIRAGIGISLVPEDRAVEGVVLTISGRANLTLPSLSRFTTLGWIHRARERAEVQKVLDQLRISDRALYEPVESFSGGNQQKLVIGKWLLAGAQVLLLYDPTRGVDIRTKTEIYRLVRAFAADGGAVLFYSTEVDEVVNLCDRALVCYRGVLSDSFEDDELTTESLLAAMLGGTRPKRPTGEVVHA